MSATPTPTALPAATVWEGRSNALRKGIRTALQAVIALAPSVILLATGVLGPAQALTLTTLLTPFVTVAQNLLEDRGLIGTWLRRPTPADAVSAVVTLPLDLTNAVSPEAIVPTPPFDQDGADADPEALPPTRKRTPKA